MLGWERGGATASPRPARACRQHQNGTLLGTIETSQPASNVAWGEDGRTLSIMGGGAVYRLRLITTGARY